MYAGSLQAMTRSATNSNIRGRTQHGSTIDDQGHPTPHDQPPLTQLIDAYQGIRI